MLSGSLISLKSLTVKSNEPDKNFKDSVIICGKDGITVYMSYIFFDLSQLPGNIEIISAKLLLNLIGRTNPNSLYAVGVYPLLEDFGEFTTYNGQPKAVQNRINYYLFSKKDGKIDLNLTDIVLRWKSGILINKGLLIKGEECRNDMLTFGSAYNSDYNLIPKLELQYNPAAPEPSPGQSIAKYYDFEASQRYINGTVQSEPIDFSRLLQATIFVHNTGSYEVTVMSQYSPNNIIWTQDTPKQIPAGGVAVIVPRIYSKYYSLLIKSTGVGILKIYYTYMLYL